MKIRIFAIGKIKEQYLKDGIYEYVKRISKYCSVEIIELKDEPVSENPSISEIEKVKDIECERILKLLKPSDYLVNLDLCNNQLKSEEFAAFIDEKMREANSCINFAIGGSYGLSDTIKKRANYVLSLSKMTFLHQMTRLILLEQIYRSFKILNNETYHK